MLRTSVFLMTTMVMAASASALRAEVSGTVGWTFSEGVSGSAVLVPGVGTFDGIEAATSWATHSIRTSSSWPAGSPFDSSDAVE